MVKANKHIDTIAALATPPGRGGIAIIRISGSQLAPLVHAITGKQLTPREAIMTSFIGSDGVVIDEGIALFFPSPHSFTGEDVLELHGHGGPIVVDMLIQRLLELGARLARPGEFSERAFLNGKMDLTQAEAVADLIDAASIQSARLAIRSLQGDFSREIHSLAEKVTHLRMYIEAAIDFTDEDIDFLSDQKIMGSLDEMTHQLADIQRHAKQGSLLREGITVVITGKPNVGKSSLLNRLSGKEIAIVTDIPGTTRDVLREAILLDGIPIHIIDTAGLRDSHDIVEQEGIRRAYQEIEKADVILHLMDSNESLADAIIPPRALIIRNKIDLTDEAPSVKHVHGHQVIGLSAKTGAGIDLFKNELKTLIGFQSQDNGMFLARRRHLDALTRASEHLLTARSHLQENHAGELAAEELRLTQRALGEMTGQVTADDLLGHIFSSFCIGK